MYVLLWPNRVAAVQMFLIERSFVFFITLFLKKIVIANPTVIPDNFPKHYSLNTFSDCFMHQNFNYFLEN